MLKTRLLVLMAERRIRTIADMAKRAGVARRTLSVGINAQSVPWDSVTIEALCKALDCQPGDFLEYVPDGKVSMAQKRHAVDTLVERSSHGG